MKKWITLIFALIMALSLCACAETENPNTTDNSTAATTSGTVPSDPTTPSDPMGGNPDEGNFFVVSQINNRIIDDEDFFVTIDLTYDEDYNIMGYKVYENETLIVSYTFDKSMEKPLLRQSHGEDGNVEGREEYTYDENGNLLTARSYSGDEMRTEAIYTYDAQGNVLTKYYDNGEEDWVDAYENTYENGKLTEVKIYTSGTLDGLKRYDGDGNLILDVYYFDGEENSREEYTYENGKLVKIVDYADGEENSCEEYTYNDNGDLLTRIISYGGVESHRQENTYNDAGQLIEIKYLNDDGYSANTVYTYAEDGSLESIKAYDEGELELESTFTSKKATVSEEQAKILTALYPQLIEEWT